MSDHATLIKHAGVYLITGGLGGLGYNLALFLAKEYRAKLILTGRSKADDAQKIKIKQLEEEGGIVLYLPADVANLSDMQKVVEVAKQNFNAINGVIHCAGILQDAFVLKKDLRDFDKVLSPKIFGTVVLDEVTHNEVLDFFVLFSSISAELGNIGQADYAYANRFMDEFAKQRADLVQKGKRFGKTVAINWGLWQQGGMQIDESAQHYLKQTLGDIAIDTQAGIKAFLHSLTLEYSQLVISKTPLQNLEKIQSAETISPVVKPTDLKAKTISYLKQLLANELKLSVEKIQDAQALEKYGIDSVLIMKLTAKLETDFGNLAKTLFFEYQTLNELAQYFCENHSARLISLLGLNTVATASSPTLSAQSIAPQFIAQLPAVNNAEIAIIGVSGRYPMANNLTEFWCNLAAGKDCVVTVPKDRWDIESYFNSENEPDKYSRWGGFIDDVDKFDPLFFNIAPKEAELMDPQERLFLETVWETLEDAGYTRQDFDALNHQVGVYVGVMYGHYQLFGAEQSLAGRKIATSSSYASIANRVSYYFNFHGPSLAIDTMCSSSLTAIHLACEALRHDECKLAIAGGVNVSIHPNKYVLLGQGGFSASDGKCKSFGKDGDGYVPGEGVGAVLLKPLDAAIRDNDQIYAVIKSTTVNHGGKTNGYTVPNPNAQAELISNAIKKANINPRTITYLEAHGTGTALGDPIEMRGLIKSFAEYTQEKQFCAIGSVKSNIGHLESAAGIAALTKVLLQLKHRKLVPSIHAEPLNPNIDFINSPFSVQRQLSDWLPPSMTEQGIAKMQPRRAGISAFGAGGANAHLILEEYLIKPEQITQPFEKNWFIVLSAKSTEQLKTYANKLLNYIQEKLIDIVDTSQQLLLLRNIAYTLQIGREAMPERLAFTADSLKLVAEKLTNYLADNLNNDIWQNRVNENNSRDPLIENEQGLTNTSLASIAKQWLNGIKINWNLLYTINKPSRISLPTYPFQKRRCWIAMEKVELKSDFVKDADNVKPVQVEEELRLILTQLQQGQMALEVAADLVSSKL